MMNIHFVKKNKLLVTGRNNALKVQCDSTKTNKQQEYNLTQRLLLRKIRNTAVLKAYTQKRQKKMTDYITSLIITS